MILEYPQIAKLKRKFSIENFSRLGVHYYEEEIISNKKLHKTIDNNELLNVINFVDDKRKLFIDLSRIEGVLDAGILKRLNKWFAFFNMNNIYSGAIYSHTISALIQSAKDNSIFRNQTTHEFELSLRFYQELFNTKIDLIFSEEEEEITDNVHYDTACYLLQISLIFAKYPGMVIGSIKDSFLTLSSGITYWRLTKVFQKLFVNFLPPSFYLESVSTLTAIELEALMHVLQGNNIRTCKHLPKPIYIMEPSFEITKLPTGKYKFKKL